ncbi:hypothetical protein ACFL15_02615 [Patescibacteria group bacterium]
MKKLALFIAVIAVFLSASSVLAKSDNAAFRGEAEDPKYPQLGVISYLSNNSGYHFWFTVTDDLGLYTAGHSYHNIYKVDLNDTTGWCGPNTVGGNPERAPYNLVGHTGETVWYKIYDVTTDTYVCGIE